MIIDKPARVRVQALLAPFELSRCTRSAPLSAGGHEDVKVLRALRKRHH
jgi:hypothetical protein